MSRSVPSTPRLSRDSALKINAWPRDDSTVGLSDFYVGWDEWIWVVGGRLYQVAHTLRTQHQVRASLA